MKGGWSDNYYYQMLSNIRKYKGMQAPQAVSAPKNITIDGVFSEWNTVTPVYSDPIGDTQHRNHPRFDSKQNLVNTTGRNDIVESRVATDASYVYFYIKTAANITSYTNPNWMMIYLNTDKNKTTGWEGFDFVLNMGVNSASQTTLKKRSNSIWIGVGTATYKVSGNQIEIAVHRSLLGYTSSEVAFFYQIFDNPKEIDNIEDNFINGESAPDRRFNYDYSNSIAYSGTVTSVEEEINEENIQVFPNPATDQITVVSNKMSELKVVMRNMWGETVFSKNFSNHSITIPVSEMSAGLYIVQVGNQNFKVIIKQ
jgi:hypothetical protein